MDNTPKGGFYHSYESDLEPDFLSEASGEQGDVAKSIGAPSGDYRIRENDSNAKSLKDAEKQAANDGQNNDRSNKDREENTEKPKSFFVGQGKPAKGKAKVKGGKNLLRKGLPGLLLAIVFTILGIFLTTNQVTMPFSVLAQFEETLDSIKTTNTARDKTFWNKQMEGGELKDPIKKRYFGFGGTTFGISKNQRAKLAKQGLYVVDDFGGSGKTVILFDDGSGSLKITTANQSDADAFKGFDKSRVDLASLEIEGLDSSVDLTKFDIDVDNVDTFANRYNAPGDFHNGYISGSRTWRGSVGAWFDDVTVRFIQSNGLTRNHFKKFQERVAAEQAGNTRSAQREAEEKIVAEELSTDQEPDIEDKKVKFTDDDGDNQTDVDENGNPKVETEKTKITGLKGSLTEVQTKLRGIVGDNFDENSGIFSMAANGLCGIFDIVGKINLMIMAEESLQLLHIVTGYAEAIDKVKAGEGDDAPISILSDSLVTPQPTIAYKADGTEYVPEGKENTSAIQSEGFASIYGRTQINTSDPSVQNFMLGAQHLNNIAGALGNSMQAFMACTYAKLAASVADIVVDIITLGTDKLATWAAGVGLSFGISQGVELLVGEFSPWWVATFTRNISKLVKGGENLGNALASAFAKYLGGNHHLGGGSMGSLAKVLAFEEEKQIVLAEEAAYERDTLSPFDTTSRNTFLGSIVYQMGVLSTSKSSVTSVLGKMGLMTSNAMVAVLPTASAYDIAETLPSSEEEYTENCPWLASIGAVGDAFCNERIITDMSTIEMDPEVVVDKVKELGGIDDNGDVVPGSHLAEYLEFWSERTSEPGIADGNISNSIAGVGTVSTGNSVVDNASNSVIGSVPMLGSAFDLVNNGLISANAGKISGESYVAKDDSADWDENQYYQRFIEDQRRLKSMDPDYESPIDSFLTAYYEENPLDMSYEGILARRSGMTKDEVIALLDIQEYVDYVVAYDPSERYDFTGVDEGEEMPMILEGDEMEGAETVIAKLPQTVVYADARNRSFAV